MAEVSTDNGLLPGLPEQLTHQTPVENIPAEGPVVDIPDTVSNESLHVVADEPTTSQNTHVEESSQSDTTDQTIERQIPFETKYTVMDGFPFPVRRQVEPVIHDLIIHQTQTDRLFFAYPSEPVPDKQAFLEQHISVANRPEHVLTIAGALWPAFYASLWNDEIQNIHAVDLNPKALEYLASLMNSDESFSKMVINYAPTLEARFRSVDRRIAAAPYLEDIGLNSQNAARVELPGLLRHLPPFMKGLIPRSTQGAQLRTNMRSKLNQMAKSQSLQGTIGTAQDLPASDIGKADFIDLSNVHEYDDKFPMKEFIGKMKSGAYLYLAEINHRSPVEGKLSELPLEEIGRGNCITKLSEKGDPFQSIDFFLFRKTATGQ